MRDDPTTEEFSCRWQPFCEIASAIGPLIGAGISLIGGSMASSAAEEGAGAQVEAARIAADLGREGLAFQKDVFNIGRADLSPYRATGGAALNTLSNMFIPGGQGTVQLQGRLNELNARRAQMAGVGGTPAPAPVQQQAPVRVDTDPSRIARNAPPTWDTASADWQLWNTNQR